MSGLDFDDFLDHTGTNAGGGGFLGNWKADGSVIVWLHPFAKIFPVWSHRFFRLDTGDKDNPLSSYKSMRLNCLEQESVLQRQRFRKDNGAREFPPVICPHCLLIEHVRQLIDKKEIPWTQPLFKFDGDAEPIVIRAGGFTGLFQGDLTDTEKAQLKQAGVFVKKAFMQNGLASLEYVLRIIKHNKPGDGTSIATEKSSLGKKLQEAIARRMDEYEEVGETITNWQGQTFKGRAAGSPKNNPCAFKFSFDDSKQFAEKYSVAALDKLKPTPEIIEQFEKVPPDIERLIARPDLYYYRQTLEANCLLDIPWDAIFKPAVDAGHYRVPSQTDASSADDDDFPEDYGGTSKAAPAAQADEEVECDVCGKGMPESAMTCPHCGAEYETVDGNVQLKPKPEKKPRTRSSKTNG